MKARRHVPGLVAILTLVAVASMAAIPATALAFPEETETQGEIPGDLNGVWLVVHHLTFDRPTPQATPGAEVTPSKRTFNVINLLKVTHLGKDEAQKTREAREKRQQTSIAKAEALLAKEKNAQIPVQTEEGEVEGGARVIVPQIPRPPGYDPAIHQGDKVDVLLLDVKMPKTVDDAFQAAQKAEVPYEPTDKALALLRSSWQSLEPVAETEYSRIEWKIIAANHYDQGLQLDPNLTGSTFAITGTQAMVPRPGQPNKNIVVYGISKASDKILSGRHVRAMMATAPFPIPIELKGTFKMIKVADLPTTKKGAKAADDETTAADEKDPAAEKDAEPAQ